MTQRARIYCAFEEFPLVLADNLPLSSPGVTVADAFRISLSALLKARFDDRAAKLAAASGVSISTISRMETGERFASAGVLERLRVAFNVSAADLFDPDKALAQIGLVRSNSDTLEQRKRTLVDLGASPMAESALPLEGARMAQVQHDAELFSAVALLWDGLDENDRLELFKAARRMKVGGGTAGKHVAG